MSTTQPPGGGWPGGDRSDDQAGWALPTPPQAPVVPPRPRRRPWAWILGAMVAATLVLGISGGIVFAQNALPILRAANDYSDAIDNGRFAAAYAQSCRSIHDASAFAEFHDDLKTRLGYDQYRLNHAFVIFFDLDHNGHRATITIRATYDRRGDRDFTLRLVEEDGDWRPCGLS